MSCFNLRFPPAKKAWKSFTSKLRSKLHNLHKPTTMKTIHKPKHSSRSTLITFPGNKSSRAFFPSSFLFKPRHQNCMQRGRALPFKRKGSRGRGRMHYLNKSCAGATVFVGKLFQEPPIIRNTELVMTTTHHCGTSSSGKSVVEVKGNRGGTREANDDDDDDDRCDNSSGFASPLMRGIDERAEEFISSFRAEMIVQEMIARTL